MRKILMLTAAMGIILTGVMGNKCTSSSPSPDKTAEQQKNDQQRLSDGCRQRCMARGQGGRAQPGVLRVSTP